MNKEEILDLFEENFFEDEELKIKKLEPGWQNNIIKMLLLGNPPVKFVEERLKEKIKGITSVSSHWTNYYKIKLDLEKIGAR